MRDLRTLPKAHLHLHLEGAMRPATLAELCRRSGVEPPRVTSNYGSFADFEETYLAASDALRSDDDLRRFVRAVVEDAAADGAVWVQAALFIPHHRQRIGPDEVVMEGI